MDEPWQILYDTPLNLFGKFGGYYDVTVYRNSPKNQPVYALVHYTGAEVTQLLPRRNTKASSLHDSVPA